MVCKGCYTNLPPGATVCEVCGKEPPTSPCPQCKTPVQEGRRFCPSCRCRVDKEIQAQVPAPLESFCPECQAPLAPHRRFCNQCGVRQVARDIPPVASPPSPVSPRENRPIRLGTTLEKVDKTTRPRPSVNRESLPESTTVPLRPRRETLPESTTITPRPRRETLPESATIPPRPRRESLPESATVTPHPRLESLPESAIVTPRPRRESLPESATVPTRTRQESFPEIPRPKAPMAEKRPIPTAKVEHKVEKAPPTAAKKKIPPSLPAHSTPDMKPFQNPEKVTKPKTTAPRRFCPECYGPIDGDVCQYCIEHPPLPPIPTLTAKKVVQPPKVAVVAASVAGVALCMGLGQIMLSDEENPLSSDNQVDMNLHYPSSDSQPSRPTESGEILPSAPPEIPDISDAPEVPLPESEPETPPSSQEESQESNTPEIYPQEEENVDTTPEIYPQEESSIPASGVCNDSEIHGIYRPVLHSYGYGLEFSWTEENYSAANLNPAMAEQSFTNASYTFWDIDGNGTPELIIGSPETGGQIMELYTVSDGQLTLLLRGNDRERYVLCQDGLIAHDDEKGNMLTLELRGNYLTIVADQRQKDPFNLTDEAKIPFTPIAEYYFG